MQGQIIKDQTFSEYSWLLKLLPENHILKSIMKMMDLNFIKSITKNLYHARLGRPSIDPEVFFRMTLIAYLFGIKSDRRLCEEIKCNLLYRWFCFLRLDSKIPHPSSLTKIRSRLGLKIIRKVFEAIVNKCIAIGIVEGKTIITDSTLIHANASLSSLVAKNDHRSKTAAKTNKKDKHIVSNKTHVSTTDPDATLAKKAGKARALRYKVHNAIDGHSRIILDSTVTTGAVHDSVPYIEQLDKIKNRFSLNIQETIADRAYGSSNVLNELKSKNIKSFIPLFNTRTGKSSELKKDGFEYDSELDLYVCPGNKTMLPYNAKPGAIGTVYRASKNDCLQCVKLHNCLPQVKIGKAGKRVFRNFDQELYDDVLSKVNTPEFIDKRNERFWKSEGVFAEAKNNHLLDKSKYRGLEKNQLQATIIACVQNIKRMVNHFKNTCANLVF